jgi:hypothetical protein
MKTPSPAGPAIGAASTLGAARTAFATQERLLASRLTGGRSLSRPRERVHNPTHDLLPAYGPTPQRKLRSDPSKTV